MKVEETTAQRLRKASKTPCLLAILFLSIENVTTYVAFTTMTGVYEVGHAIFFIRLFGLQLGILLSFLIVLIGIILFYGIAYRSAPEGRMFAHFLSAKLYWFSFWFWALWSLSFGLLISAINDSLVLIFRITTLALLDPITRYLVYLPALIIGWIFALNIEKKIRQG